MHQDAAMSLPNELKNNIAMFCIPSSLASLARVHTSYRQEAERVLYQKVYMRIWNAKGMCCLDTPLDTLSSNPEKASFVHSLTVEFPSYWNKSPDECYKAVAALLTALCHLKALSDLRIRLPYSNPYNSLVNKITDTIRNKHFQLHTLYCNDYLNVAGIIEDQQRLRLLGIYIEGDDNIELARRLEAIQFTLPMVCLLARTTFLPTSDHLHIFPAFSTNNCLVCQALTASFDQDISCAITVATKHVHYVSIWLEDFSNTTLIRDIVEDVALYFPSVFTLDFMLRYPSRTVQPEIKNILSVVTQLSELNFSFWDWENQHKDSPWVLSVTLKKALANEWMAACPELRQIQFLDGFVVQKDSEGQ